RALFLLSFERPLERQADLLVETGPACRRNPQIENVDVKVMDERELRREPAASPLPGAVAANDVRLANKTIALPLDLLIGRRERRAEQRDRKRSADDARCREDALLLRIEVADLALDQLLQRLGDIALQRFSVRRESPPPARFVPQQSALDP